MKIQLDDQQMEMVAHHFGMESGSNEISMDSIRSSRVYTTMAIGEEDFATTMAIGEEC